MVSGQFRKKMLQPFDIHISLMLMHYYCTFKCCPAADKRLKTIRQIIHDFGKLKSKMNFRMWPPLFPDFSFSFLFHILQI